MVAKRRRSRSATALLGGLVPAVGEDHVELAVVLGRGAQRQAPGDQPAAGGGVGDRDLGVVGEGRRHLLDDAIGGLHRRSLGQGRLEVELALGDLRDQRGLQPRDPGHRERENRRRGGERRPPAAKRGAGAPVVEPRDEPQARSDLAVVRVGGVRRVDRPPEGAEHRDQGHRHHQRGEQAQGHRDRHVAEELRRRSPRRRRWAGRPPPWSGSRRPPRRRPRWCPRRRPSRLRPSCRLR